jgi:hypothetical protein
VAEQVKELLPNALDVSLAYDPRPEASASAVSGSRRSLRPTELFADFWRRKHQADPPPEVLRLFETVYEDVHAPEAPETKVAS